MWSPTKNLSLGGGVIDSSVFFFFFTVSRQPCCSKSQVNVLPLSFSLSLRRCSENNFDFGGPFSAKRHLLCPAGLAALGLDGFLGRPLTCQTDDAFFRCNTLLLLLFRLSGNLLKYWWQMFPISDSSKMIVNIDSRLSQVHINQAVKAWKCKHPNSIFN